MEPVLSCAIQQPFAAGREEYSLKEYRLQEIQKTAGEGRGKFVFVKGSIADKAVVSEIFDFVSLPYMDLQVVRIWRILDLRINCGEVTYADTGALERDFGFKPGTGLRRFTEWSQRVLQCVIV